MWSWGNGGSSNACNIRSITQQQPARTIGRRRRRNRKRIWRFNKELLCTNSHTLSWTQNQTSTHQRQHQMNRSIKKWWILKHLQHQNPKNQTYNHSENGSWGKHTSFSKFFRKNSTFFWNNQEFENNNQYLSNIVTLSILHILRTTRPEKLDNVKNTVEKVKK